MDSGWTPGKVVAGLALTAGGYVAGHALGALGWSWPSLVGAAAGAYLFWITRGGQVGGLSLSTTVKLKLPFGLGDVELKPDTAQRDLAWWVYVEMRTRVVTAELAADEGDLGVALTSLYTFFGEARGQLRDAGPQAGVAPGSVGGTVFAVLNEGLRPFLSRWHPPYDAAVRQGKTPEADWPEAQAMRTALTALQADLRTYLDGLAEYLQVAPPRRRFGWPR